MHAVFWAVPIVIEIIPLFAEVSYGMDDGHKDEAVQTCFNRLGKLNSGKSAVLIIGNQLYFYIGIIVLIVMSIWTNRSIQSKSGNENGSLNQLCEVAKVMRLYPVAAVILYFPAFLYMLLVYIIGVRAYNVIADSIFGVSVSLYGIANTLIYFSNSQQAVQYWKAFLFGKINSPELDIFSISKVTIDASEYDILDNDIVLYDINSNIDTEHLEMKRDSFLVNPLMENK
jgi:hypothetical protein